MNPTVVGTWQLVAATSINCEIPIIHESDHESVPTITIDEWLYGNSHALIRQAPLNFGLRLQINADATFTETGTNGLPLTWFDVEGVLTERAIPFDGVINCDVDVLYLHAALSDSYTDPVRAHRVRYDDGDTIVCDRAELIQGRLVRTMSVVTDELYADRSILIYQKVHQSVTVPGLGILTNDRADGAYYSQPQPIPVLGGRLGQLVLDGYAEDTQPADFHLAIANFLAIDPSVLHDAAIHIFQYYQDCLGTADEIPEIAAPEDVWQHIHFRQQLEISVMRNSYVDEIVYISLSCGCDWEDEHGLQVVFQNGLRVSRVGPNDGHLSNMDENSVYP
jgi:hypothetical protein